MQNKAIKISLIVLFIISLILVIGFFISIAITNNIYATQLDNLYQKSFSELKENVDNIEVDISKLVATNSTSSQSKLLKKIYVNCNLATANINNLPIDISKINGLNNFLNTCGGYSYSLIEKLENDETFNEIDIQQIEKLHTQSKILLYDLNSFTSTISFDYSILKNIKFNNSSESNFNAGIVNQEQPQDEPSLIYDGPFSDSVRNKTVKGLSDVIITESDAKKIVEKVLDNNYTISYMGTTLGNFETYNYTVNNNDIIQLYQVTKKGGLIISVTSFGGGGEYNLSLHECVAKAENYINTLGINNMYSVWHQKVDNIVFVNLAPIENGVIFYLDLIKIKIDATANMIIGLDAKNYAYNHINRNDFYANFGILEGDAKISNFLEIIERNKCFIPNEFVGESMAYEYICKWKDYTYYIYLDALTGAELNIMRVINTTNGDLLM